MNAPEPVAPLLRVVRGNPTPEELAALIAVVIAVRSTPAETPAPASGLWATPHLRTPPHPGPGAWTASGRPR